MSEAPLPRELIEEAKKRPGGWVYEIVGNYSADESVPPDAIRGAWRVDLEGRIVGAFIPNPGFKAPPQPE